MFNLLQGLVSQDIVRNKHIYHAFSIVSDGLSGVLGRLAHNKKKSRVNLFFSYIEY